MKKRGKTLAPRSGGDAQTRRAERDNSGARMRMEKARPALVQPSAKDNLFRMESARKRQEPLERHLRNQVTRHTLKRGGSDQDIQFLRLTFK